MYNTKELLKKVRKSAGMTQGEFAEALGVSQIAIAKMETQSRTMGKEFAKKLAKALDVHPMSIYPSEFHVEERPAGIEGKLYDLVGKLQKELIEKKAKLLNK